MIQVHVSARTWRFDSSRAHHPGRKGRHQRLDRLRLAWFGPPVVVQEPGVLASSALRGIDDQLLHVLQGVFQDLLSEILAGQDHLQGHDPVLDDLLVVVDVAEEKIQRRETLDEAPLEVGPLRGGNDPRNKVEGGNLLRVPLVAISREGGPLLEKGRGAQVGLMARLTWFSDDRPVSPGLRDPPHGLESVPPDPPGGRGHRSSSWSWPARGCRRIPGWD